MTALVCVDVQYDFLPGGSLAVAGADEIIPVVKKLKQAFESRRCLVVATQDWHPPGHGSFASTHGAEVYTVGMLGGISQTMWPDHCVQGSTGAQIHKDLAFEKVVQKGTAHHVDSYSGFFDNAHGHDTGLNTLLKDHNITDVFVCGLATDYCVKYTCQDALKLGYKVYVIQDGVRGVDLPPGSADLALKELEQQGCILVQSDEVEAKLTLA